MSNTPIDRMAHKAAFRTAFEITTSTDPKKVGEFFGMDIVSTPLMPEGWFALKTEKGAICFGPKGSIWVPFFDASSAGRKG